MGKRQRAKIAKRACFLPLPVGLLIIVSLPVDLQHHAFHPAILLPARFSGIVGYGARFAKAFRLDAGYRNAPIQ